MYVASARPPDVGRVPLHGPVPDLGHAAGGCDGTDATGAPLDDVGAARSCSSARRTTSLDAERDRRGAPNGNLYVSSVINGVIAEFDADGTYLRNVLQPPAGETLGAKPVLDRHAARHRRRTRRRPLYYADIGIVVTPDGVGPGDGTGTVRRIRFVDGEPQPPETMDTGLAFPDGIGVYVPK